jgi:hypothetical protein
MHAAITALIKVFSFMARLNARGDCRHKLFMWRQFVRPSVSRRMPLASHRWQTDCFRVRPQIAAKFDQQISMAGDHSPRIANQAVCYPEGVGVGVGVGVCALVGLSFFCEHWTNAMLKRMHPAAIMRIKIFRFMPPLNPGEQCNCKVVR